MKINNTAKVLIVYLVSMTVGQAAAVGIGLLLDPYSKTLALAVFIPLYYAMFWLAWRFALLVADRTPATSVTGDGTSGGKVASWLLAPAVLALDLCD